MENLNKQIQDLLSWIIALIFLLQISACKKDFLEAKPDKNLAVPITLIDFQSILDDFVAMNQRSSLTLGEVASDGHYVTDVAYQTRAKNHITDAFIWSKTMSYVSVSDWSYAYARILNCNIILHGLPKINSLDKSEQIQYNNVKGQALFQRARTFFELSQIFAPQFDSKTAQSDPGIIMRLTSDITLPSKRSTNEASYKQIIDDLNIAKDLLPDRPQIVTRASKTAALALLARIYLSMENYDMAFQSADQCLKIYSALLDYNNVIASANFIGVYNSEVLFHANYSDNFTTTNYLIDRGLYESYQGDDLRKSRLFRENATTKVVTFKGNYDSGTSLIFCGLATDEVYLIRAECYARAGKITDSMRDLNDLMKMRWDKTKIYPVITANDQEDAIRKILLERRKELVNRGIRWSDLRRLNKDSRFAVTLKRTVLGVEYTLEPNSYRYTFPIPDDIVQQIGITQNPGW